MWLRLAVLVSIAMALRLRADTGWSLARDGNLQVYSHRGAAEAGAALTWLEQLRALVKQHLGIDLPADRKVYVFGFQSESEYEPYRLRTTSDAYYVATDGRDYIVLPALGRENLAMAAHEFAHLVSHAAGVSVPPWLGEGLAEVFSTIRFTRAGPEIGGEASGRMAVLRSRTWLPLRDLLSLAADAPLRNTRAGSNIFYAESWALTEMLLMSPEYGPRFSRLLAAFSTAPGAGVEALEGVCGKPLAAVAQDLETWVKGHKSRPLALGALRAPHDSRMETSDVPDLAVETMLAGMLLATGDLGRAETMYRQAAADAPEDPAVLGGLAAVAAAKNRPAESSGLFARALARGLADPELCYRYAVLLDRSGASSEERRPALERAVALQPGFDDARYALALLEKNLGENEAAIEDLRAMRHVAPARAYHYWLAMADALTGAGRNDEAVTAARKAAELASNDAERAHAEQLAFTARTHLAVRLARDSSGRLKMVTTRVANDATDFNPFIEPADDIRRVEGKLREIDCSGPVTRMIVETPGGSIAVAIPDPSRVQMRKAPPEFVCGPQEAVEVAVQYAANATIANADGVARGIEFR